MCHPLTVYTTITTGLSDGAVAAALALEEWTGVGSGGEGVSNGVEDLHLPPPIFSRVDQPKDYA